MSKVENLYYHVSPCTSQTLSFGIRSGDLLEFLCEVALVKIALNGEIYLGKVGWLMEGLVVRVG